MKRFSTAEETLGYVTAQSDTNTDRRFLVSGSQNVLIDQQRKFRSRNGYSRLGAANSASTPIRNSVTWNTSTGSEFPMRVYDDELEVYLGTIDTVAINAWKRVVNSLSTTEIPRFTTWWDTGENLDQLLFVEGTSTLHKWGGGVAVVDSVTAVTVTKKGTTTFAQNRFYTTGSKTFINLTNGTEYTYTGGETTTTLTGIADTTGISDGDILVQKVVQHTDEPAANRNNHTIFTFENQVCLGSEDDNEVFMSQNDSITDYSFSTPRVAGEGALLTLDGPSKGFGSLGETFVAFTRDGIFTSQYQQETVSSTIAETVKVKKLDTGDGQGAFSPDMIAQISDSIVYLSNEPALRIIESPSSIQGLNPKTLSNPIKPDFDAETFSNGFLKWYRNGIYLSAPASNKMYILEFVEDADGKLLRFWDPPQILPARSFFTRSGLLHIGSNSVAETYLLFDGSSDVNSSDEKLPFLARGVCAYNNYKDRINLKNFDEYFVEGEISPQTNDLLMTLNYDYQGTVQITERTINGTNEDILLGVVPSLSLGQQPLGQQPIGGYISVPTNTRKFRVIFEIPREDFHEMQAVFETNEIDRYFAIIAHGANARISSRRNTKIML